MKLQNTKDDEKNYSVPNLERALTIIELLMEYSHGLTLAELQDKLGFPKSSLFRITQTLVDRKYLIKCEQPSRFILSKKFLHIGLSTLSESSLVENSLPVMRQIRDELKETVLLGSLADQQGVLLEQVLGLHPFTFMLKIGKRFNLHASAPGKAIIAFMPPSEQEVIIARMGFEKFNNNTITTKSHYLKELIQVKSCGYSFDHAEELDGVHCVGAPIFNQYGYPIAALWVTAPSARLPHEDFDKTGRILKEAGLAISRLWGFDN
ncbi:IclR family transcriptional regulator [Carboxylicivirga sediminis]|uniref:IclR family transcriptional regulator n=1 Tax=Carboxylicivirga sediminis TaxID=2006564 RepID=A0A941F1B3_9BACT|nr:IclR family transcriptional regulator [Carboxylicivirga sediminis]MBR8535038.1 IclR family transcriptional regulator [Carboxylicivirga sediminis]